MKKQWVVVGILAATLFAGDALAQHKTPNQQPNTAAEPPAPTGEVALGSVRLAKGVTADGKALAAGTYQVRVTAQIFECAAAFRLYGVSNLGPGDCLCATDRCEIGRRSVREAGYSGPCTWRCEAAC